MVGNKPGGCALLRTLAEQEADLPERLRKGILAGHGGLPNVCYGQCMQTVDQLY